MLKITVQESAGEVRLQLEGKVTAPWVNELESCWRAALATPGLKRLEVDLSGVDYADAAGKYLLALMHAYGAELGAPTLALKEIVAEIQRAPRSSLLAKVAVCAMLLAGAVTAEPLRLTLKRAVEIATSPEGSAKIQIAAETVRQSESRSAQARAALLPDFDASVSHLNQTRNLAAMGIQVRVPIPGFTFPTFVGPFDTFDARANLRQNVFDLSSIRRYQASRSALTGARAERDHTAEQVAAAVARAYLAALKSEADVEAAAANVQMARAVLELVENQKAAGTGTGIEITRARVQLANEEQRLLVAKNQRRRARLELLRATGLRLDTEIELDGSLAYQPVDGASLEQLRQRAFATRADLKAQRRREEAMRLSSSAATLERLPAVSAFADYGSIGTGLGSALPTRTYGIALRVPVFDGGRRDARRSESKSQYRAEQARTRDLEEQIELELRVALDALASADEQVKVAASGLELATNELAQARRRYAAGVATSIEVTDAQTRLERARDNHIAALFAHNLARIDLAVAQGAVEDIIR